jgi:hypothetical protein
MAAKRGISTSIDVLDRAQHLRRRPDHLQHLRAAVRGDVWGAATAGTPLAIAVAEHVTKGTSGWESWLEKFAS